jgi:hypothetical protein
MQILEFNPVTMIQFVRIADALKSKGLTLSGTQGEVRAFGADVKFDFTEPLLKITVVSAPHFRRIEQFVAQIQEAVTALLASPV